jgi:hypothetical protein
MIYIYTGIIIATAKGGFVQREPVAEAAYSRFG